LLTSRGVPSKARLHVKVAAGRRGAAHGGHDAGDQRPGRAADAAQRHARARVLQHERVVRRGQLGAARQRLQAALLRAPFIILLRLHHALQEYDQTSVHCHSARGREVDVVCGAPEG